MSEKKPKSQNTRHPLVPDHVIEANDLSPRQTKIVGLVTLWIVLAGLWKTLETAWVILAWLWQ